MAKDRVLYSKTVDGLRVDFVASRSEYACKVVNVATGAVVSELCYPKLGRSHDVEWLNACADEAASIGRRDLAKVPPVIIN